MRFNTITCDWCGAKVTKRLVGRTSRMLIPHATWEGHRDTYEYCSMTCAQAAEDHAAIGQVRCEFAWDASDGREDHRHTCKQSLYNGRVGGNHLGCWCECGASTDRPPEWLERRLREHLEAAIDDRVSNALVRPDRRYDDQARAVPMPSGP